MAIEGALRLLLDAQTSSFNASITDATNKLKSSQAQMNRSLAEIKNGFSELGIVVAEYLSIKGFSELIKNTTDAAQQIKNLSQELGVSTDQVQKYQYAAQLSGISLEQLQSAFNHLNREIADGKVPYTNLQQALNDIANRMANTSDGAARARLAFEAFGKAGVNLIPMLANGARNLKDMGDEAQDLGVVLSAETIQKANEFSDQIETLGMVIKKNFQAGLLEGFIDESRTIREIYTDPAFVESIKSIGAAFGEVAKGVIETVKAYRDATTALAAFGIAVGAKSGWIDKDVAQAALEGANDRLNPASQPLKLTIHPTNTDSGSILINRQTSALDQYVKALQTETSAIGESEKKLAEQNAVIQAQNAARRDYENHLRISAELTPQEKSNIEQLADAFYDLRRKQQEAEKINEEMKSSFLDTVEAYQSGSQTMKQAILSLIQSLAQLLERELILQPLADSIFGLKGSGGLGIGGLLTGGSSIGSSQGTLARLFQTGNPDFIGPLPGRASGGPVAAGELYKINEMGVELFRPSVNGEVIPLGDTNGVKSGNTYYIDASGADQATVRRLEATILSLAGPGVVERRVFDAQKRGAS